MQRCMRFPVKCLGCAVLLTLFVSVQPASGQTPENVLIVVNTTTPESIQVGEYYQRKRRIPTDNLLRITAPADEQISRDVFERQIESPIVSWITRRRAHDRLLYIVLTKGIPLRIAGSGGRTGSVASVDSEMTLLYRRIAGLPVAPSGSLPNPYFHGNKPIAEARPFTHERFDFYLVTRLDGYTVADVIALIDRAAAPERGGRIVLDARGSITPEAGNQWLERAAEQLRGRGRGARVVLDSSAAVIRDQSNLLGYFSWGSNDPAMTSRQNGLTFEPGAIAGSFVSTDGRTFKEPPASWTLGRWDSPVSFFGGSPQSLIGDLIRQGVSGVAGHVAEPYLDATIRPDVLFPAYVSGFNLAEAYYLAMPYLSWQTIIVGDPLMAPFRRAAVDAASIDPGIDPATEMPVWFAARALKVASSPERSGESASLTLRAQSRLSRDDFAGAREALEQATAKNPKLVDAQMLLATLYEQAGDIPKALDRYRVTIAASPGHVGALNNLAYALATSAQPSPETKAEAVVLARRAAALAPRTPAVLDTLAWVLHRAGDNASARSPIALAIQLSPMDADMLLHGAAIDLQAGDLLSARARLDRALAINPALQSKPEVQEIRAKLPAAPAAPAPAAAPTPKVPAPPAPGPSRGNRPASR
jgi:uncharacterized protein (TIGR03790 family)